MSKELKEIYGAERVLKIKTFLEMIVYTDELSKINLEYLMDNAEVLLYAIEQAERVQELEDIIYKDERQAVLESMYEQNKRYREVIKKAIDDLENECLWDALVALKALEESE